MQFKKITNSQVTQQRILEISKKFSVTKSVAELLLARGICDDKSIKAFLNPSLNDLHDPMLLDDMPRVVKKIKKAIKNKERILVFGDYDVDGISATYILLDYFKSIGGVVEAFLPNRYIDGYGLTIEALDKEIAHYNPNLIITVDCGITCYKEVEYLKTRGIETIITDHHNIPEILPDCLVIDAKKPNQRYPFNELCGTGIAFKLVEAMSNRKTAMKYLPITALATVADIVPLVDENRAIVKFGLDQPLSNFPEGIAKLAKYLKINKKLTSQDIGFKIAPKINAAGRMGNAQHSLNLYLETDKQKINQMIAQLIEYNTERQDICNVAYEECRLRLEKMNLSNVKSIVMKGDNWNIGILGIVAARISEEFNRPTFLFGKDGEFLKGSCRSIEGVDIHKILGDISSILTAYGGHTMAAGVTIEASKFEQFAKDVENNISQNYDDSIFAQHADYDLEIGIEDVNEDFVKQMSVLEPFGCQNPTPIYRVQFDKCICNPITTNSPHLTIQVQNTQLLCFNHPEYYNLISQHSQKDALIELKIDSFRGKARCKGVIKYVEMLGLPVVSFERIGGEYIKQLALSNYGQKPRYSNYNQDELDKILNEDKTCYGTLLIAHSLQSYKTFFEQSSFKDKVMCFEYLTLTNQSGLNTLCLCPSLDNKLHNFKRIVLLDSVLDESYIIALNNKSNAKIYLPQKSPFLFGPFNMLDLSRKTFGEYYNLIKQASKENLEAFDDFNYYNKLRKFTKNINFIQFVACVNTFKQIGILDIEKSTGVYKLKVNTGVTSNLETSYFYNKLSLIIKTLIKGES